jgi:hypothetical protein
MAKVRFYVDVPEMRMSGFHLYATTAPSSSTVAGFKRVAFDVDMPPEVWRSHDVVAPVGVASVIEVDPPEEPA